MFSQLKRTAIRAVSLTAIFTLLGTTVALAASGGLDGSFSGDGKQTTDFGSGWQDLLNATAVQPDGKIVAVGERIDPVHAYATISRNFSLARYEADGDLDSTFSGDGMRVTDFGGLDAAYDIAIQDDGKIVVSGKKCNTDLVCGVAVARYNTNGSLDGTFSMDGKLAVALGAGNNESLGGLAIQPDGRIVVAGFVSMGSHYDFAVFRLNSGGTLDNTFDGDGRLNIPFGAGRNDYAADLALSGSTIMIAGSTCDANDENCNFAVARVDSSGVLDATFSGDGKQTTDFGANDEARGIAVQADGKIVLAGPKEVGTSTRYAAVARYNTSGTLDPTFSGDGKRVIKLANPVWANDVQIDGDGKIVLAGGITTFPDVGIFLARLNPANGSLDTTFSGDGRAKVTFGGFDAYGNSLSVQADGKYVVGGFVDMGTWGDYAVVRVLP